MSYAIWHNPRCSKSRAALALLEAAGVDFRVRRYRDDPPTVAELEQLVQALGVEPQTVVRMGEPVAKELGLASARLDRSEWLRILAANPILLERPIVVAPDGRAVIGRPPENVSALLRTAAAHRTSTAVGEES